MSFAGEINALSKGQAVPPNSRLSALSSDATTGLIRVGGHLRQAKCLKSDALHPIVLRSKHPLTRLIVQHYDAHLLLLGPERVFEEIRHTYWITSVCGMPKMVGKPIITRMADLLAAQLRIHKPAFWSTGVDGFGPFPIKIGHMHKKRWGIIFKC